MGEWIWDNWLAIWAVVYAVCVLGVCWAAWPR